MIPTTKAASITASVLLTTALGCSLFAPRFNEMEIGYTWELQTPDKTMQRCANHTAKNIPGCTILLRNHPSGLHCLIISSIDEDAARRIWTNATTDDPTRGTTWAREVGRICLKHT